MQFICPCCGKDITDSVKKILRDNCSAAGSVKTVRKTAAQKKNMERLNAAAYTPEKRAAAAQKRLATLAAKKNQ